MGGCAPFWGELGSHLKQSPGPNPTSIPSGSLIHPAIWPQQIWAENWGLRSPLWGTEAGSPFNTMWPGPRTTFVPIFILIRPTVWSQYTNVTDRTGETGQTDKCPIAQGEPFYKRSPKNVSNPETMLSFTLSVNLTDMYFWSSFKSRRKEIAV